MDDANPSANSAAEPMPEKAPLADLLKTLRDDTTTLLRQEVALAKTEASEKAAKLGRNAAYIAAGAFVALLGAIFLLMALTALLAVLLQKMGLSAAHSAWVAPLIVGAVITLVGYVLIKKGLDTIKRESLKPEKTIESLREDKQWLQNKVAS
jgi:uncharacterized membrane protein